MKHIEILLVSHVYHTNNGPVYGPVDVLEEYLKVKKVNYSVIKYKLNSKVPLVVKSFLEGLTTFVKSIFLKPRVYIGIDPLNALTGLILFKLGLINKTIFYCVDYTPTRFKNSFVNNIYLFIDKLCSKGSSEVWNVSSRIIDIRKKQGVVSSKIKFVPNSPKFESCPRLAVNRINHNQIVMVTGQTHSQIMEIVLKAFKSLLKHMPKLKLKIIGTGSGVKLKNVEYLGQLSNSELLNIVSTSRTALAIYNYSKEYSWTYYGDSKKTREYLACGIPVITTPVVSTSDDVKKYNAGLVVDGGYQNIADAIKKIITDNSYWIKARKNALKCARDMDITRILDDLLSLNNS